MKQRIITGIFFGLISLALILYSDQSRFVFLCLVAALSAFEYLKILGLSLGSTLILLLIGAGLYGINIYYMPALQMQGIVLSIFFTLYLFSLRRSDVLALHSKKLPILWLLYIPINISLFANLIEGQLVNFLLAITVLIWIADSGAYFVGMNVGKRKFAPSISPKKTWEGFLGGGMLTLIAAYIFSSLTANVYSLHFWLLFGLIVWFFGALGDLAESHIKRTFKIKDSSNLLPGHGGFLDRFDGFIYCLPFLSLLILLSN